MTILVTGGTGYIGSHACVELLEAGYEVVVVDNLANSRVEVLDRVHRITGHEISFHQADVRDRDAMRAVFSAHSVTGVLHFAGLKVAGESLSTPLAYYDANVGGSIALAEVMGEFGVRTLVFSSSAAVYGEPERVPVTEAAPLKRAAHPYGRTKQMVESVLADLQVAEPAWRIALLRYFNPVGAHPSGLIGEDPRVPPTNLMPVVAEAAAGERTSVMVHGDDYPTPDGTGIRDFIHVVDLARAHVAALEYLQGLEGGEVQTLNLGTGHGYSVLELLAAFERASGRTIRWKWAPRRQGDVAVSYADPSRAEAVLGWRAELGLATMCDDAWRWKMATNEPGRD
jgi:UDP-glucose 4-epimerase